MHTQDCLIFNQDEEATFMFICYCDVDLEEIRKLLARIVQKNCLVLFISYSACIVQTFLLLVSLHGSKLFGVL
jgi:hypothetical protein